MIPSRRRPDLPQEPTVEDLTTYEKASQTAIFLAERLELIKKAHSMLCKMEQNPGTISALEIDERVRYITTNLRWLIAQCKGYARKLGIDDVLTDELAKIENQSREDAKSHNYYRKVRARDYRIIEKTSAVESFLYDNGFLFSIQRPPPDVTASIQSNIVADARVRYYREHPPVRTQRPMRKSVEVAEPQKDADLEKLDKGIEDLEAK